MFHGRQYADVFVFVSCLLGETGTARIWAVFLASLRKLSFGNFCFILLLLFSFHCFVPVSSWSLTSTFSSFSRVSFYLVVLRNRSTS